MRGQRHFIYHPISISRDIWDSMTSIKQEQKQLGNFKNTLGKLKMIVETKWVGSKRLENISGHRKNRPPQNEIYERKNEYRGWIQKNKYSTRTNVPARETTEDRRGEIMKWIL